MTLMTCPESEDTLVSFYRLIRPAGPGWKSIAAKAGVSPSPDSIPMQLLGWVLGCAFVYATLFGAGSALYGSHGAGHRLGVCGWPAASACCACCPPCGAVRIEEPAHS